MASIMFWRNVSPAATPGFDEVNSFFYDTVTTFVSSTSVEVPTGVNGEFHPPVGSVLLETCEGLDLVRYKSQGDESNVVVETLEDNPACCNLQASDFSIVRTNNTDLGTPNGSIVITAPFLTIADYEASIDAGANWVAAVGSSISFTGLPAGNYSVIIRATGGVCSVTSSVNIVDNISYPPLIISESTQPALYAPIFYPITLGYLLDNNTATVKNDGGGTYLEVLSVDARDYLATLPIIKILQNEDYAGNYQINSVDDPDAPTKFYFSGTYTSDQAVMFVPFDRQVFQLFAETAFNVYGKIADITVYPNADGEYLLRLEGFLQSVFKINPPVNMGVEIALLRKYYVVPRDFDMSTAPTVFNAVYSAVPDLTNFLGDLIPLGPAPINYINEQTQKGFPVLFSYIDTVDGRIKNITSSNQTEVVDSVPEILLFALPFNEYDFLWINPAGAITTLNVTPALPDWITLLPSASDTVKLKIDTGVGQGVGDYAGDDYDGDDYLIGGPNSLVGCYTFEFFDIAVPLFTLTICIYPIQSSNEVRCANVVNIAWANRQGGWSSAVFDGKRVHGIDIGTEKTFKEAGILKRSVVEEVYDTVEVTVFAKSKRDVEFIKSLRQSIQAFMWDENTLQWSIPIKLDRQSGTVYEVPFKQVEVLQKLTFKLAEEIIIQTQ